MAIYSGRRISATGTYRRFPIVGTALIAIALFLLSHIGVDTPFWESAIYMALLGAGLGLTMQVLLIAAQNSVPYAELGVATSLATFSRSIGGSIGVAVFGTIFNNRLALELPKHVPAAALAHLHGTSVTANPAAVKLSARLPIRDGLRIAFSDSLHVVFLVGGAVRVLRVPARAAAQGGAAADRRWVRASECAATPRPEGTELGESLGMSPSPQDDGGVKSLEPDAVSPGSVRPGSPAAGD